MASADQACYTLISGAEDEEIMSEQDMKVAFEKGTLDQKSNALKMCIKGMLRGEKYPMLLMFIIRFLIPMKDHIIKKLLLLYLEIVPKTVDGKLLPQMILVCDAYRKELQSPNEYVRGSTLRFLCKLKEAELLEPLMPAIRPCLEHRHSYVRRNAVLCIYTIYKNFDFLMPDAPEVIHQYLMSEQDMSCRRNAFMMLVYADRDRALDYLGTVMEQVQGFGDILQLIIVELVYKVCRQNPGERARFIRCIYLLLNSTSPAVRYEAAGTLLTLSTAPTAIQAAANCYMQLVIKERDNNVRLIVLQRISDMRNNPAMEKILQGLVMDLLRVLAAPDLEVRKRTLEIVMGLVTSRAVEEVLQVLKKEITKTYDESETNDEYRRQLVRALHTCAVRFPEKAVAIVPILMEFIGDTNSASAGDVITSVREAIEYFPELRQNIVEKLLDTFPHIKSSSIYRAVVWILGEYSTHEHEIDQVLATVKASLGELPLVESEMRKAIALEEEQAAEHEKPKLSEKAAARTAVTADGTYITQSAFSVARTTSEAVAEANVTLRTLLMEGDFFVATTLATTLAKLALRRKHKYSDQAKNNRFAGECMLIMASILHLGRSGLPAQPIETDTYERIMTCLRVMAEPSELTTEIFNKGCRAALKELLSELQRNKREEEAKQKADVKIQVDDCIKFQQLGSGEDTQVDEIEKNLAIATGAGVSNPQSTLNKVVQLTGFGDPVYAEAYVNVNQYDITLDVLIVNQTTDTLQGLSLELATLGDLKLIERPSTFTVGPRNFVNATATIKVSSTDTGIISGTIVYDISGTTEHCVIVLNDIYIDVMDYIVPASCTEVDFRAMWAEFEWENKVTVNTDITSLEEYTQHICATTNMRCLTLESGKGGECGFYAANLYARSIFGEDALANLSIEKTTDGRILGHIRIRAKTQGIALSLGDKITLKQKTNKALPA